MDMLSTVLALFILSANAVLAWICVKQTDRAHMTLQDCERTALDALSDRPRVTVLERDLDALRRELRKLSGKFYAMRAELEQPEDTETYGNDPLALHNLTQHANRGSVCDNWSIAQRDGPLSDAASCECSYCVGRRAERRALRAALVPKTVQGQAETAKLNAGKP